MRCDHCAHDVPDGVFCTRCGAHQGTTADVGNPKTRVQRYAAHPAEHVVQPSIFTTLFPHLAAQDNMNTVDQYFKDQSPDARHCPGTQTTSGAFNGAKGIFWNLCFTITSGGHSVPAASQMFAGANASESIYYLVMVVTRDGNLSSYLNTAKPVLEGIHWKLS